MVLSPSIADSITVWRTTHSSYFMSFWNVIKVSIYEIPIIFSCNSLLILRFHIYVIDTRIFFVLKFCIIINYYIVAPIQVAHDVGLIAGNAFVAYMISGTRKDDILGTMFARDGGPGSDRTCGSVACPLVNTEEIKIGSATNFSSNQTVGLVDVRNHMVLPCKCIHISSILHIYSCESPKIFIYTPGLWFIKN